MKLHIYEIKFLPSNQVGILTCSDDPQIQPDPNGLGWIF